MAARRDLENFILKRCDTEEEKQVRPRFVDRQIKVLNCFVGFRSKSVRSHSDVPARAARSPAVGPLDFRGVRVAPVAFQ